MKSAIKTTEDSASYEKSQADLKSPDPTPEKAKAFLARLVKADVDEEAEEEEMEQDGQTLDESGYLSDEDQDVEDDDDAELD